MSDTSNHQEISSFRIFQQRISIVAWSVVLLLSVRGLYDFLRNERKGMFEQAINYVTEPLVQLFNFNRLESIDIPGISVLFAAVSILLISYTLQLFVRLTDLRYTRTRSALMQQAIQSK